MTSLETTIKTKTTLEIIEETVAYYSANPNLRATNGMFCVYSHSNGNQCAVGRCLQAPESLKSNHAIDDDRVFADLSTEKFYPESLELFKPEYRINNVKFWAGLQHLHDNNAHWSTTGLTSLGADYVEKLMTKYS